jgi:hypothetical protein
MCKLVTLPFAVVAIAVATGTALGDLAAELQALDQMRRGSDTPYDEVEAVAENLLKRYPSGREQGEIYCEIAHIYSQTGMVRPRRLIECAEQALRYPIDPWRQCRLYVNWGDAMQMPGVCPSRSEMRRQAAKVYLTGLQAALGFIAAAPPELPPDQQWAYNDQLHAPPPNLNSRDILETYARTLRGQIVALYSDRPYAIEELQNLVRSSANPSLIDELVNAIPAEARTTEAPLRVARRYQNYMRVVAAAGFLTIGSFVALKLIRNRRQTT